VSTSIIGLFTFLGEHRGNRDADTRQRGRMQFACLICHLHL
jgi:hypothetical protein